MEANIENNKTNMWHKITSRLEHWHKVALFLIIYDVAVVMGSYFLALWLRFDCRFSQIPDWYLTPWLKFAPIYGVISVIVFWRLHDIANCVREIASEQIKAIVNVEAVNLVYEAKVPQQKSGPSVTKNTMLVAILGPVACISILTVVYILDDSIRTEEDVERYLGLSVFGVVPVSTELNSYIKSTGTVNENGKELLEMPKV